MEAISLAVGIPSLLSTCIDTLERIEAYKDFGIESRHEIAQFEADKLRLKKWADGVGISDGKWKEVHNLRLKDHEVEAAVKNILIIAREIFDATERTRSRLRVDVEENNQSFSDISDISTEKTKNKNKASSSMSIRGGLGWAFKRRGKFINQVGMFAKAVDTLYKLVPPTGLVDHINDGQNQDRSGSASIEKDVQLLLEELRRVARQQQETEIIDWLDLTKFDEQYNARHRYENLISSYLEGTCEWIFSKSAYCEWALDDSSNEMAKFLWICGPPGFGKTVLCARIVQHFKEKLEFPVAYFFSSAHAQSGGQPSAIVRSWIGQIARIDSDALDLVRGYRERSESGWIASETDIWTVFKSIISLKRKYALFLDGFDEYARLDDIRAQFLHKLKKAAQGTTTRILISSKNETDIKTELSPETSQTDEIVMLKCEISKEDVRDDTALYSQSLVDRKLPKKDEAFRKKLARQLAEGGAGMFLWIKLQEDQLRGGKTDKQLVNIVKSIPFKLNKIYERNWKTIQNRPGDEQKRALAILRWVTFALRPLTVSELAGALIIEVEGSSACLSPGDSPETIDDEYIDGEMIDICGCLIETREEKSGDPASFRTIHLIHSSVREFFLSALPSNSGLATSHSLDQASSESEQHNHLARICLAFLNHEDVWKLSEVNQYSPRKHSLLANFFHSPLDPIRINSFPDYAPNSRHSRIYSTHKNPFLHYAANHWHSHINRAGNDNNMVIDLANDFLCLGNKNFDLWRRYFEFDESTNATPLYYAVLFDLIPAMKFIWEKERPQLNSVGGQYGTPLQAACVKGHFSAFNLLIDWGADPNVEGGVHDVPLNAAIAIGRGEMVKSLIKNGASLVFQDSMQQTPLYIASLYDKPVIVEILLKAGANPNMANKYGNTPLNKAARKGHLEVIKLLLDKKADVTISSNKGWTPLNSASSNGHFEVVKLLLNRGADVTISNNEGWTPLNSASSNGHFEVIKLLLDRGADFTISSNEGWTPLNSASNNGHFGVVELLLDRGADFKSDNSGWTPLNSASSNGHFEVVKLLLDRGADFKSSNNGWTPLNSASSNGHFEVVKLLLDRGADFKSSNSGRTPLNSASSNGHFEVVKLLLDRGADFTMSNNQGWTPMYSAAFHSHLEVLKLLLDRGADATLPKNDRQLAFYPVALYEGVHPPEISRSHPALQSRTIDRDVIGTGPVSTNSQPLEELVGPDIDVNLDGPIGMLIHVAAYKGNLKMLQMLVENFNAHVFVTDRLGRTPLHIAARGGNIDCVNYLLDRGLCCSDVDNIGNKAIHYACSSASAEVIRRILELDPFVVDSPDTWTPLHWACRSGGFEVIHLLLSHGFHKSLVHTEHPSAWWTPVSIGVFHRNPYFKSNTQQSLVEQLQVHDESYTGSFPNNELPLDLRGSLWCNGCFHGIYGPRFHCRECVDFDFCFMCMHTSEKAHPGHSWQELNLETV